MAGLNKREEAFCKHYSAIGIAGKAAIAAGYSKNSAGQIGFKLLKKDEIQNRLKELDTELFAEVGITKRNIMKTLSEIAGFDIRKLYDKNGSLLPIDKIPDECAIAVGGIETFEVYSQGEKTGETRKVRPLDKLKAIDQILKVTGWEAPTKVAETDVEGNDVVKQVFVINGKEIEL